MKVMDDAIDAVIVGSIGATSAAVRALSRGASYYLGDAFDSAGRAKKEDDGDGDSWLKTPRGERASSRRERCVLNPRPRPGRRRR